jgi:hypothetical protein
MASQMLLGWIRLCPVIAGCDWRTTGAPLRIVAAGDSANVTVMPQQRLWQAVESLAGSADPIQERLYWAGMHLAPLLPDDFEDADRAEFIGVMSALNAREAVGDEGTLKATTETMSDQEAVRIARRILALDAAYRPLT